MYPTSIRFNMSAKMSIGDENMMNKKAVGLPMSTIIIIILVIIVLVAVGLFFFTQFSGSAGQISSAGSKIGQGITNLSNASTGVI